MEDITDVDYRHAKRVLTYFNNKNRGDHVIMICMFNVVHYCLMMYLRILEMY